MKKNASVTETLVHFPLIKTAIAGTIKTEEDGRVLKMEKADWALMRVTVELPKPAKHFLQSTKLPKAVRLQVDQSRI